MLNQSAIFDMGIPKNSELLWKEWFLEDKAELFNAFCFEFSLTKLISKDTVHNLFLKRADLNLADITIGVEVTNCLYGLDIQAKWPHWFSGLPSNLLKECGQQIASSLSVNLIQQLTGMWVNALEWKSANITLKSLPCRLALPQSIRTF